ncbi:MAG: DMT family transporter, partial [Candidatus Dormibacterales bacterium]
LITGLFIVFTPLIDRVLGVPIHRRTWAAVLVALAGTLLLAGGPAGFGWGELLTLGCALLVAVQIVMLSRWAPGLRPAPLAMVQMGAGALMFTVGGSWSLRPPSGSVWIAIVVTGVFASALAFYIQTWAQQHLSASRAALVLATEPAWAVVAAVVLAGQRFGVVQAVGALLVLAAIVGHEVATVKFEVHGQPASP